GRYRQFGLLRVLRVEILDPSARSVGGRLSLRIDVGSPVVDTLFAHDDRHDAALHSDRVPDHGCVQALDSRPMSLLSIGLLYGGATLFAMFLGIPIAFALGAVATLFMIIFMPSGSVDTVAQNVYEEMGSITLLSIPLFILKGAAIGRSPAGRDLYGALHAWMHWIPGGLGIANVFACALFAAMAGSSPATCSAIGSAGIPEMRKRGYSPGFASGIIAAGGTLGILLPPSITMILYAV